MLRYRGNGSSLTLLKSCAAIPRHDREGRWTISLGRYFSNESRGDFRFSFCSVYRPAEIKTRRNKGRRINRGTFTTTLEPWNGGHCCGKRVGKSIYYGENEESAVHSWRVPEWREGRGTDLCAERTWYAGTRTRSQARVPSCASAGYNGINKYWTHSCACKQR